MRGALAVQNDFTRVAPPCAVAGQASESPAWMMPAADVAAWLQSAKAGARLIYGRGPQMVQGATQQLLAGQARDGAVLLFQPRSSVPGQFDFMVIKRLAAPALPARRRVQDASDPKLRAIYRRLQSAAARHARCPTDIMLAAEFGLTVGQVKWRLRQLAEAKRIRSEVVTDQWRRVRVVTIMATGDQTAGPTCAIVQGRR